MARLLDSLEEQLAVSAGINLLAEIGDKENTVDILTATQNMLRASHNEPPLGTQAYTPTMTGQSSYSLITLLHQVLFERSFRGDDTNYERPGSIVEPNAKVPKLRNILNELSANLDTSKATPAEFPAHYAKCYRKLAKLCPFAYGNEEVFGLFFTILTKTLEIEDLSFDLRRISHEDAVNLSIPNALGANLEAVFAKALDRTIFIDHPNVQRWSKRQEKATELAGLRFLTGEKDGSACLITINGGYVPLNTRISEYGNKTLQEYIDYRSESGQPISSIKIQPEHIIGYVVVDYKHRTHIDGISLKDGEPLLCMEVNPTTGLTARYEKDINEILKQNGMDSTALLDPTKITELKLACGNDQIQYEIIDIAAERKQGLQKVIDDAIAKAFEGKDSVGVGYNSVLFTAGGAGSGKGSVGKRKMIEKCGTNFVTASLDDARYEFQMYHLMVEVGHHADDYMAISNAAIEIRKGITERALKEGYNLLYDGSGIPWEKYSKMIAPWKERVKDITVCAVECELYVPPERRGEFPTSAVDRAEERFEEERRTLPYSEMIIRHSKAFESYLRIFYDQNVDDFTITDNAGTPGTKYTLAEKFTISADCLRVLNAAKQSGNLLDELKQRELIPDEGKSTLTNDNIDFLVNKKPDGRYDILVITNKSRSVDVARKGSFNTAAIGDAGLPFAKKYTRWIQSPEILTRQDGLVSINCAATRG